MAPKMFSRFAAAEKGRAGSPDTAALKRLKALLVAAHRESQTVHWGEGRKEKRRVVPLARWSAILAAAGMTGG